MATKKDRELNHDLFVLPFLYCGPFDSTALHRCGFVCHHAAARRIIITLRRVTIVYIAVLAAVITAFNRRVSLSIHRFYNKNEIHQMCDPDAGKNDTRNVKSLAHHHYKAEGHKRGHGQQYLELGPAGHSLPLYVRFEIVFIQLCSEKPIVQPLGRSCKAIDGNKEKRHGRQYGKYNADTSESEADTTDDKENYFFQFHLRSSDIQLILPCSTE